MFQPKEPRPLLVTSGSTPLLESHGSLWTALDGHTATHPGSVAMGKKASFGHKESRELTGPQATVYMGTLQAVL